MKATTDILSEALTQALETMAFLSVGPVADDMRLPAEPILATMRFRGPRYAGTIEILSGAELGRVLAENIGCVQDPDSAETTDAWKEVCNVTCGLVIPAVAESTQDVYDVTVPDVTQDVPSWGQFVIQPGVDVLNAEGFAVAARLKLDKP